MNSVSRKSLRIISVTVAICLFQVYVLAGATTPNADSNTTSTASNVVLGRLMLVGTESILVNGHTANSGTTILSGSQLQTSNDVEATVQLGSAGKLYISPNTNLTVTFDKTNVDVMVASGSAFVAANAGVKSSVNNPSTAATAPGSPAPSSGGNRDREVGIAIVLGFVVVAGVVYWLNSDDGSQS